jgi:hypothetical protein
MVLLLCCRHGRGQKQRCEPEAAQAAAAGRGAEPGAEPAHKAAGEGEQQHRMCCLMQC